MKLELASAALPTLGQHYLDKKRRMTVGLGGLLVKPKNVVPLGPVRKQDLALTLPKQISDHRQKA
jgi:hypothetical protein